MRGRSSVGDIVLAHRYYPAIKEKYPNSEITAFIDSEGATFQKEALETFYPAAYKEIKVIPAKKYSKLIVNTQFGPDSFYGAMENVPDDWRAAMESYDKFFDLHIDGLKFITDQFNWYKYFYRFPEIQVAPLSDGQYTILHLASNLNQEHKLQDWYIARLVESLAKVQECKVIITKQTEFLVEILKHIENIEFVGGDFKFLAEIIGGAAQFICLDSGLKYIAYSYGVPVICFTRNSPEPHRVFPSHRIRWLIFESDCLPLNYDVRYVVQWSKGIKGNKGVGIIPSAAANFDQIAINRIYSVNKELSCVN